MLDVQVTIHEDVTAIPELQEDNSVAYPFGDLAKFQRKYHLTDEQWLRKYGYLQEEPQVEDAQSDEQPDGNPLQGRINTWNLPEGTVDVTKRPGAADISTEPLPHTAQPKSTQFTLTDDYYAQVPLAMRHALERMYQTKKGNLEVPFDADKDNKRT